MNEVEKLQKELDAFNARRKAEIAAHTVHEAPTPRDRGYTYRKTPTIRVRDLAL